MPQLPPESATSTALRLDLAGEVEEDESTRDPESEQWSRVEHLLASIRDELHVLRWLYSSAHSDRRLKWEPEPLERPGVSPVTRKAAPTAEQISLLAAHLALTQGDGETTYDN